MISDTHHAYLTYHQGFSKLSLSQKVILHYHLIVPCCDVGCPYQLILRACGRYSEIVDELRREYIHPLRHLILAQSSKMVVFVKRRY